MALGASRPGVSPCSLGCGEIDHGGGKDEQVPGDGCEGEPKLHCCLSNRWQVVRGGRSVLTLPVCDDQGRMRRALPCSLPAACACGLAARPYADMEGTPGAPHSTTSAL
jgi:hypothetical protein